MADEGKLRERLVEALYDANEDWKMMLDDVLQVLREWPDAGEVAALVGVQAAIESVSGATAVRFTSRFTSSTETWLRGCIVRAPKGDENADR